jgi:adenylate cyclase
MSGVEIHAHILAQILDDRGSAEMGTLGTFLFVAGTAVVGLLLAVVDVPLAVQPGLAVGALVGLWAGGVLTFVVGGPLVPLISPSLSFYLAFAGGNGYWKSKARKQRRFIREAFSRFTAPAVVDQLLADPNRLRLGGEWREISCVFTDLAGFTSFMEKVAPETAVVTLNSYLKDLCVIAVEHGGTIDKIVGDSLHVMFGAPLDQHDHPERAVRCALAMGAFGRVFADEHGELIGATRIGVHTGNALVGNFGGDRFFNYTAYGDVVNTASRLETANKVIGTSICVSGETASRCRTVTFRPIGSLLLKGKENPVEAFEPLAATAYDVGDVRAYVEAFGALGHRLINRIQILAAASFTSAR